MDSNNTQNENPYSQNVNVEPIPQPAPEVQQQPSYMQQAPEMQQNPYMQQTPEFQQAQNNPYQQYVPVQPVYQQVPPVQKPEPKENSKLEKLLCFLSLGLYIGGPTVSTAILYMAGLLSNTTANSASDFVSGLGQTVSSILSLVGSGSYIAAWVLMIIARVKFKKSVFAKVLMWVYIGMLALSVIAVVVVVVSCINALRDCPG